jgi:hypothetical protein
MLGPIVKPFKTLAKMAIGIIKLVLTLLKMLDVFLNPVRIMKLIIVFSVVILLFALSLAESVLGMITGTIALVIWLVVTVNSIIYMYIIFVLSNIIFAMDYVLNDILHYNVSLRKIFYQFFLANEQEVNNWYNQHSFEKGNNPEKYYFMSFGPCTSGYTPFAFVLCKRHHKSLPLYSLQANIERLFRGLPVENDLDLKRYSPSSQSFYELSTTQKKLIIRNEGNLKKAYVDKRNYYYKPYETITKSTCILLDHVIDDDDLAHERLKRLKEACFLKFCRNGSFENFCPTLSAPKTVMDRSLLEDYLHYGTLLVAMILFMGVLHVSRKG